METSSGSASSSRAIAVLTAKNVMNSSGSKPVQLMPPVRDTAATITAPQPDTTPAPSSREITLVRRSVRPIPDKHLLSHRRRSTRMAGTTTAETNAAGSSLSTKLLPPPSHAVSSPAAASATAITSTATAARSKGSGSGLRTGAGNGGDIASDPAIVRFPPQCGTDGPGDPSAPFLTRPAQPLSACACPHSGLRAALHWCTPPSLRA